MMTTMDKIFPLEPTEVGFLLTQKTAPDAGGKYPIYIPRLMPNIPQAEPVSKPTVIPSSGPLVFKNSPQCRFLCSNSMKTVNYLSLPLERNNSWDDSNSTKKYPDGPRYSNKGAQVKCHAETDIIDEMTFSTN